MVDKARKTAQVLDAIASVQQNPSAWDQHPPPPRSPRRHEDFASGKGWGGSTRTRRLAVGAESSRMRIRLRRMTTAAGAPSPASSGTCQRNLLREDKETSSTTKDSPRDQRGTRGRRAGFFRRRCREPGTFLDEGLPSIDVAHGGSVQKVLGLKRILDVTIRRQGRRRHVCDPGHGRLATKPTW